MSGKLKAKKAQKIEELNARAAAVRMGGKGTARRTKKVAHRKGSADDKKLQGALQRVPGFGTITGIEEVNMFDAEGNVLHFQNPRVQGSVEAATFSVTGHCEKKKIDELLPGIINQLGIENLMQLKNVADAAAKAEAK